MHTNPRVCSWTRAVCVYAGTSSNLEHDRQDSIHVTFGVWMPHVILREDDIVSRMIRSHFFFSQTLALVVSSSLNVCQATSPSFLFHFQRSSHDLPPWVFSLQSIHYPVMMVHSLQKNDTTGFCLEFLFPPNTHTHTHTNEDPSV